MATARVQGVSTAWTSGSTITRSITVSAGNLIVVSVHMWAGNSTNTLDSVADGTNGAYTLIDAVEGTTGGVNVGVFTYYLKGSSNAGGTFTVTATFDVATVDAGLLVVEEISGADVDTPLNVHAGGGGAGVQPTPGTSPDAVTSTAVTANAGDYVFAAMTAYAFTTPAHGTGYTDGVITAAGFATEYIPAFAGGSKAGTFTLSGDAPTRTAVAMFKVAAGAGGGPLVNGGSITHGSLVRGGRIAG